MNINEANKAKARAITARIRNTPSLWDRFPDEKTRNNKEYK